MKSIALISSGVFLIMNVATAAPEHLVSYDFARVDGLDKDYLPFGQFGGLFGRIELLTKPKYEPTCYQNNVKSYPAWQQWLRDHQPPLLVLWGRYDTSFTVAGGEAYRFAFSKPSKAGRFAYIWARRMDHASRYDSAENRGRLTKGRVTPRVYFDGT